MNEQEQQGELTPIEYILHRAELKRRLRDAVLESPGENVIELFIKALKLAEGDATPYPDREMYVRFCGYLAVVALLDKWGEGFVAFNMAHKGADRVTALANELQDLARRERELALAPCEGCGQPVEIEGNTCRGCGHIVCVECSERGDHWLHGKHEVPRKEQPEEKPET